MKIFLHDLSICVMCGIIILGLIGLPSIIRSSSLLSSSTPNPNNFYQPVFAQPGSSSSSSSAPAAAAAQGNRPNVLLIVGDDFGWSDIGAFGSQISTPNLDALAKDGKILTNYHTIPVCSPARDSLITGVDHHIGGIGSMYELIAQNQKGKPGYETWINNLVVTVAELLRDAGYHTYMSGKWHLSGANFENGTWPHDRGFEKDITMLNGGANHFGGFPELPAEKVQFAENGKAIPRPGPANLYSNDLYAEKMIEYIKNNTDGKPFFGYLAFQVAHSPFQSPQATVAKYEKMYQAIGWDEARKQSFENQKKLGFWNADMKLPERIPPDVSWTDLTPEQQAYASRILAVRAAMIENMDHDVGRVIQLLKDKGQYDNTLIVFVSDNGSSEPAPLLGIKFSSANENAMNSYLNMVNNSLSNLGNVSSTINYAAWGSAVGVSPLSGFKVTEYEGGTRVPFIVKEPTAAGVSSSSLSSSSAGTNTNSSVTIPKMIKAFAYVEDVTPTILDYAGVQPAGTTYKGHPVHAIMGKSLKSLFNGTSDKVYGENDVVADEMFNNTAVYTGGSWKAIKHEPPTGDGKWQLYNIVDDPGENHNVADQHPDILQKLSSAYGAYSKDVGVVIPRGQTYYLAIKSAVPPLNNQSKVTITSNDISPAHFSNPPDAGTPNIGN
jgi:arylsulfatase A-like enzyme